MFTLSKKENLMNIVEKLDCLAELNSEIEAIEAPLSSQIDALANQMLALSSEKREQRVGLVKSIQSDVLELRQTIRGEFLQAIYRKGVVTWDASALREHAIDHPEILELKKMGKPSVRIAEVK